MATIYADVCPTITLEPTEESAQSLEIKLSEILENINSIVYETDAFVAGTRGDVKAPCEKINRDSLMSSLRCDIALANSTLDILRDIAKNLGM